MSAKNTPLAFWSRVTTGPADTCWNWAGAKTSSGYGNLSWHGQCVQAHRVAYYLAYGGIELHTNFKQAGVPREYRQFVLHKCDNRLCCNPEHLFLGSMSDNQKDAYNKRRKVQPQSKHTNAKLTPGEVAAIRCRYAAGEAVQQELAVAFGVSQRAISLIVRGETYKDVQ